MRLGILGSGLMGGKRATTAVALTLFLAPAAIASEPVKLGKVSLTYYWIIDESAAQYRGRADATLCDARGCVIARTSRKFRKALVLEGTGWLRDGRAVVYDRKIRGQHRFRVAKEKCGYSITGCPLIPYRTAAVDPHFIKLGSKIFIPQLKGARLPDGTIHDGIFIATDRGHFHGRHVDLFVGTGARAARPFVRRGYPSRSHVSVVLLQGAANGCGH
jgi:3D (Asp-Asp-Asp) domain-containing protein